MGSFLARSLLLSCLPLGFVFVVPSFKFGNPQRSFHPLTLTLNSLLTMVVMRKLRFFTIFYYFNVISVNCGKNISYYIHYGGGEVHLEFMGNPKI